METTGIYLSLKIAEDVSIHHAIYFPMQLVVEHDMEFNFIALIEKGQD